MGEQDGTLETKTSLVQLAKAKAQKTISNILRVMDIVEDSMHKQMGCSPKIPNHRSQFELAENTRAVNET